MATRSVASPVPRASALRHPGDPIPAERHGHARPGGADDAEVIDLVHLRPGTVPAQYITSPSLSPAFQAILRLGVVLALAGGCLLYLVALKDVTILDSGQAVRVQTFAPTVGDALERSGVALGPNDRVDPQLPAPVPAGGEIEVMRAKPVVVEVNGERTVEQSTGRTVDEVLQELSIASQGALIAPPPATRVEPGDEIVVGHAVDASVVYDGQTQQVRTNVLTAGALLRQLGVVLGPHDRVEPSILAYPGEASTIRVVRVNQAVETLHSRIAFDRRTEQSSSLEMGTRRVQTPGVEGIKENVYRILYEDGRVASRTLVSSQTIREPVAEVSLVGTNRPALSSSTQSQTGKASWYRQPGLMGAHRSLPFGTVVKVTNLDNGRQVTVTIRDRGPYIDGRIIDLSDTAFNELAPISRGVVNVKIEW